MRSLVVTTPATDRTLLTINELRSAAGVTSGSRDVELRSLETEVADAITSECNIAIGSGADPTLRRETLTETFYNPNGLTLILSRRHNITISSVTVDGSISDASDYFVNSEDGILSWMQSGYPCHWGGRVVVVVYDAGFATVPPGLKQAATDYLKGRLAEAGRDPFVKSISQDVPGLMSETKELWVGSVPGQSGEGPVPDIVAGQLKRFRNSAYA